jgi:hypothetical protein
MVAWWWGLPLLRAIPGRKFDQVQSTNDPNVPFGAIGEFTDAELISLATFVRSNNRYAGPLTNVSRLTGGSVQVQVSLKQNGPWATLEVRFQEGRWVVQNERMVIE